MLKDEIFEAASNPEHNYIIANKSKVICEVHDPAYISYIEALPELAKNLEETAKILIHYLKEQLELPDGNQAPVGLGEFHAARDILGKIGISLDGVIKSDSEPI